MKRVLAIDPITKGFGFAVLDGPQLLVNWGLRGTKRWPNPRQRYLREITKLLDVYSPDRIVVDDCLDVRSRRGKRNRQLIEQIIRLAGERGVRARRISRAGLHRAFALDDAWTKYKIALAIVRRFPELGVRLPPARKPWMSEKAQMGVFDAVALALAFYANLRTPQDGSSETVTVPALKGGETAPSIMRRR